MIALLELLLVIALIGGIVSLILQIPMLAPFRTVIIILAVIFVVLLLLAVLQGGTPLHLPRLG